MKQLQDAVLKRMRRKKMLTVVEISDLLKCAIITARRRLRDWKAWRSCNGNGKFYTLPEIPSFDDNGLWQHEGILFSKHGNLKQTLLFLVSNTADGLNGADLRKLLGIPVNGGLVYGLRDAGLLRMEKVAGRVSLFDADEQNYQRQRSERINLRVVPMPKCEDALMVFVEMLKCPGIEPREIVVRLRNAGRSVSEAGIQRLLVRHQLTKKKPIMP